MLTDIEMLSLMKYSLGDTKWSVITKSKVRKKTFSNFQEYIQDKHTKHI